MTEYIIIYVISAIGVYFGINKIHSKGGPFSNINPTIVDMIITFVPLVNTVSLAIIFFIWTIYKIDKIFHSGDWLSKFFRIKK